MTGDADADESDEPGGDAGGDWTVVESEVEYETGWYAGGYDLVRQPDGSEKRYYWAELPPAVVVVAVDRGADEGGGDEVVMVEQYRPAIREECLELPAGIVERADGEARGERADGKAYEAAGARELREETGLAADSVSFVEGFWCATGVLRHRRGFVVAEDLQRVGRDLDDNEFLSVRRVPVEDALAAAREEPANDATIEGLLLAEKDGYL